ncbi:MAG: hypothetical protein COV72_01550 [Candidatus Omnitrophica bacterium CG11_big_fil_rev_8_21_14_0_20_42_13]|uniref:Three-Cys-motif partner protein TcmP n=1 Tax=Candidatus Ghiorseimicrobium undicola TaxID=1974746 RepID=A0A2H0LZA3_9BACT|nr:MAG: hypothetical protein COV72_01550 [Candidatus Omnitrophica bacterium CG11_big_fil_rev_8_21_14_0_20_42_13]
MTKKIFGLDIVKHSKIKLQCIQRYLSAYSNIITYSKWYKVYYFIDGFAGTGYCKSKGAPNIVNGSATIALNIKPPFTKYFFIELDQEKAQELECLKTEYPNLSIKIFQGDCNVKINDVLQEIESNAPFIALLDPQAGDLYWDTIVKIAQKNKAELFINFPFGMAINRYMPLEDGKNVDAETELKLNKIFGSEAWKPIYGERKKGTISSAMARDKYLDIYLQGLKALGFKYYAVKNLKNSKKAHIYYLIFATRNRRGLEKMKDHLVEGEPDRNTLFFNQDISSAVYNDFSGCKNVSLDDVLEKMLAGKHLLKIQDFKNALIALEKDKKLSRINPRPRSRSFNESDRFNII